MLERSGWWPVLLDKDLPADRPVGVTVLGHDVVLWRDAQGQVVALTDQCPHRGARLSMGRISQDQIQCPYHGWVFEPQGRCIMIPAQPGFTPPAGHSVCRHAAVEAHGLIWVCLDPEQAVQGSPWPVPVLADLPARRLVYGPWDVATSAPRAVENFLDTSHFAFVHEGWLGAASHPEVPPYDVSTTPDGRPVIEAYRAWQPRASASAEGGAWVTYRYEVLSPYAALLGKKPDADGPRDCYTIWACPLTPESCRVWFAQYTSDEQTPAQELLDFQNVVFGQDQPILESQRPKRLPVSGGEKMGSADRLSAAYRRYLQHQGITFGVC